MKIMLARGGQEGSISFANITFAVYIFIFPPLDVEFDEFELLTFVTAPHFFQTIPNNNNQQHECYDGKNYFKSRVLITKIV